VEEGAISLYYAATDRLSNGSLEAAINCASTLRLEGRHYEAIDILDSVLHRDRDHPNANQKMAEILWAAYMACRGSDFMPKALLVAALWHYETLSLLRSAVLRKRLGEAEAKKWIDAEPVPKSAEGTPLPVSLSSHRIASVTGMLTTSAFWKSTKAGSISAPP